MTERATSDWLRVWSRFRPEAEALFDAGTGRRWTWTALYAASLAWAAHLEKLGVGRGDRAAVLAHNRGETLALLFACAERGAILFPMNWRLSPAELRWQLQDCTPTVLLCDAAHHEVAAQIADQPVLSLDDLPQAGAPGPGARRRGDLCGDGGAGEV